jgi:AcrR family transcriptional regulator
MLEAVSRLVTAGGVDAVTMRDVARVAGVGMGSVYQYFATREQMLAAWEERSLATRAARIVTLLEGQIEVGAAWEDAIASVVVEWLTILEEHLACTRTPPSRPFLAGIPERHALNETLVGAIVAAMNRGWNPERLRVTDLESAARVAMTMITNLASDPTYWRLDAEGKQAHQRTIIEMVQRYLLRDPREESAALDRPTWMT